MMYIPPSIIEYASEVQVNDIFRISVFGNNINENINDRVLRMNCRTQSSDILPIKDLGVFLFRLMDRGRCGFHQFRIDVDIRIDQQ